MTKIEAIPALLDALEAIYDESVSNLRTALMAFRPDIVLDFVCFHPAEATALVRRIPIW